jgi:hypothetical protein
MCCGVKFVANRAKEAKIAFRVLPRQLNDVRDHRVNGDLVSDFS